MSELIEYDALEGAFGRYFDENAEVFRSLFDSIENLDGIVECRIIVFPERMYDQFPATIIFLDAHSQRVFVESLHEATSAAIKRISHLPNIVGYEDVDPEVFDVEFTDGRIVSLFVVVRDLLNILLRPFVSNSKDLKVTIGLHDEEPTIIAQHS